MASRLTNTLLPLASVNVCALTAAWFIPEHHVFLPVTCRNELGSNIPCCHTTWIAFKQTSINSVFQISLNQGL